MHPHLLRVLSAVYHAFERLPNLKYGNQTEPVNCPSGLTFLVANNGEQFPLLGALFVIFKPRQT